MNIICVKWGYKYSHHYVNNLFDMIKQYTSLPFDFYCYTDDNTGIYSDVNIIDMPDDGLEEWWPKLRMFEKGFIEGKCVFFDLDTVIHNNIDDILLWEPKADVTMIKCFWKEGSYSEYTKGMGYHDSWNMDNNSSCLVWYPENMYKTWDHFWSNPEYFMMKYIGIDRFMTHEKVDIDNFPAGWFYSRLFGATATDRMKTEPPWYFLPDYKVCMFNSVHKLSDEDFKWADAYKGFQTCLS